MRDARTPPHRQAEQLIERADRLTSWTLAHSYLTTQRVPPKRRTPPVVDGRRPKR
jgi:hypothetical protein